MAAKGKTAEEAVRGGINHQLDGTAGLVPVISRKEEGIG